MTAVNQWENAFQNAQLPMTQDGKLDTAKFSPENWKSVDDLHAQMNKPDGAIAQATKTIQHLEASLRQTNTMASTAPPEHPPHR
jgi:hypothetical protein